MAQKPLKKVNIKANDKKSKYKKVLANPKTDSEKLSKQINKNAIKKHEEKFKVLISKKKTEEGNKK
jgi:hypothetical protein